MGKTCPKCGNSEPEVKIGGYILCSQCRWKKNTKAEEYPEALKKISLLEERIKYLEKFESKYQKHKEKNIALQTENDSLKKKIIVLELENEKLNISLESESEKLQATFDIFAKLNLKHGQQRE